MLPFFAGVGTLLRLFQNLSQRRGSRAGRGRLPILWLVRDASSPAWLSDLDARLYECRDVGQIPHTLVDCDSLGDADQPLPALDRVYRSLRSQDFGAGPVPFRHYELARWLTQQRLPPGPPDQRLRELLRRWRRPGGLGVGDVVTAHLPGPAQLPFALARVLGPEARFRLWASGRVPGFGQPRWFLAQRRYLTVPVMYNAANFLSLAEHLTAGDQPAGKAADVERLLVAAFLRDLCVAYRRRPWRVRPWRRTANVVALLENADAPEGTRLVERLADVRARAGGADPLLVVASGADLPTGAPERVFPVSNADDAYDHWLAGLPADRAATAAQWLLPLRLPPFLPQAAAPNLPDDGRATGWKRPLPAPPWPPLARRRVLWPLAVVLLVLAGTTAWVESDGLRTDCHAQRGASLALMGGECVGLTTGPYAFSPGDTDAQLQPVQQAIFQENRCAEQIAARSGPGTSRPLVTLAYYAGLTAAPGTGGTWAAAQVAEMEGILTWQRYQNVGVPGNDPKDCQPNASGPHPTAPGPVIRVALVNGGSEMRYADRVTMSQLIPYARHHDLLGVIGLDRSVSPVSQSITDLGAAGIPTLATTLSGDGLAGGSPFYLQLGPTNVREAQLVAEYAVATGHRTIDVYYPGATCGNAAELPEVSDLYIYTLVRDIRDQGTQRRLPVQLHRCAASPQETQATIAAECVPGHLFFYAGRSEHFADFLADMNAAHCAANTDPDAGRNANRAALLADDSVTRYLVEAAPYYGGEYHYQYVSKEPAAPQAGTGCLTADRDTLAAASRLGSPSLHDFCVRLAAVFQAYQPSGDGSIHISLPQVRWADERTSLAYDAAGILLDAVAHHWTRVSDVIAFVRANPYAGVTGMLDFSASQSGDGNQLAVLSFTASPIKATCQYLVSGNSEAIQPCQTL